MRIDYYFGMVVATLSVLLGTFSTNAALYWGESPDAGDLPDSAQNVYLGSSLQVDGIIGSISSTTDRDMYRIHISSPSSFSITLSTGAANAASDTILALFDLDGNGLVYNDNIDTATDWGSTLTGSSGFISTEGDYYLGVMSGGQTFQGSGGSIWNEAADFDLQKGPDGDGAPGPITGYSGAGTFVNGYTISFTGISTTVVPEPGFYGAAFALMGLGVAGFQNLKSRKSKTNQRGER